MGPEVLAELYVEDAVQWLHVKPSNHADLFALSSSDLLVLIYLLGPNKISRSLAVLLGCKFSFRFTQSTKYRINPIKECYVTRVAAPLYFSLLRALTV